MILDSRMLIKLFKLSRLPSISSIKTRMTSRLVKIPPTTLTPQLMLLLSKIMVMVVLKVTIQLVKTVKIHKCRDFPSNTIKLHFMYVVLFLNKTLKGRNKYFFLNN